MKKIPARKPVWLTWHRIASGFYRSPLGKTTQRSQQKGRPSGAPTASVSGGLGRPKGRQKKTHPKSEQRNSMARPRFRSILGGRESGRIFAGFRAWGALQKAPTRKIKTQKSKSAPDAQSQSACYGPDFSSLFGRPSWHPDRPHSMGVGFREGISEICQNLRRLSSGCHTVRPKVTHGGTASPEKAKQRPRRRSAGKRPRPYYLRPGGYIWYKVLRKRTTNSAAQEDGEKTQLQEAQVKTVTLRSRGRFHQPILFQTDHLGKTNSDCLILQNPAPFQQSCPPVIFRHDGRLPSHSHTPRTAPP